MKVTVKDYEQASESVWVTPEHGDETIRVYCQTCGKTVPGFYVVVMHPDGSALDEHEIALPHECKRFAADSPPADE